MCLISEIFFSKEHLTKPPGPSVYTLGNTSQRMKSKLRSGTFIATICLQTPSLACQLFLTLGTPLNTHGSLDTTRYFKPPYITCPAQDAWSVLLFLVYLLN